MEDKERILIVDDDETACRTLSLIFGKKGYETETAGTGQEAIEKAEGSFFNVALLDVKLPDMEGVELLALLREMHPDMAVIVVTGYASLQTAVQALNEGASAYITKPLDMDKVLVTVREVLERQRLVEDKRRMEKALRVSHNFLEIANRHTEMIPLLEEFVSEVRNFSGCAAVGIRMLDEAGHIPYQAYEGFSQGFYESESPLSIKLGQCMCINVTKGATDPKLPFYTEGGSFYMNGTTRFLTTVPEEEKGQTRNVCNEFGYESVALVPIRVEDRILGLIHVADPGENMVSLEMVEVLEGIAMQLGTAIQRVRGQEALKRRAAQLALINDVGGKIAAVLELDSVLDRAARLVQESFDYHHVALFTLDRERGELVMRARAGDFTDLFPLDHRLELDQGIVGWVGRHGQTLLANDVDAEPRYVNLYPDVIPTRSELSVPIRVGREAVGVLDVQSPQRNAFNENDVMVMETLADQIAVAIENARLYEAVQQELAERKRVVEALRESEERYRRLVEFSPELIAVHSEGKILYINTAGVKLLGAASPEELIGKPIMDLVYSDYQEIIKERVRQSHEQGKAVPSIEEKLIRFDGQVIDVETAAVPITYQGKPAMLAVARDITERKQLETQLRQAQKMETLGSLAAGIAHDFNNLLTPMGGFAALLLGQAPEGSQQQEYLRYIKVAAERAAALTRQLRLFTRQEEGERHPLQLNSVVEETRELLEHSIPKEITIELHLASELWAVEADPSQISQVLMNLGINARDAMPDGGTLTLETRNVALDEEYARAVLEARPGRYVRLSVSDTGCGMSPEVQARIFEPFFTTKEAGKGTGLGLSVVYGIVKGHGGFISVYSEEGRGSTFRVYLPAIELAVAEREIEALELPTGTETILLVDDEEIVQVLGQSVLEYCGYTVLMAENGVQALEMYQAHQGEIALVVLDVVMPRMAGRECLHRLRELDPQVKVLVSTGYMAKGLAQELVAESALGLVEKPFLLQDFAIAVRAALDQS